MPENCIIFVDGPGEPQFFRWDRRRGDIYISGTLKGELTVASANDIYITGYNPTISNLGALGKTNTHYTGGLKYYEGIEDKKSIFGIIANNNIEILSLGWPYPKNGVGQNSGNVKYPSTNFAINDIKLHGAFFALNGSFKYDYKQQVDKGTAELFGSLVQKTRAAWRAGSRGYNRKFTHDPKMKYKTPPFFLEPTNSGWEIREWREVNDHVTIS